jgi:hypothetical protein
LRKINVDFFFTNQSNKKKRGSRLAELFLTSEEKIFPGLVASLFAWHSATDCESCAELQMSRESSLRLNSARYRLIIDDTLNCTSLPPVVIVIRVLKNC